MTRKLIEKAIGEEVELFVSKAGKRRTDQIINNILKISRLIEVRTSVNAIKRDPDDNKVLACAVESKSEYLVSGDVHLLDLKEYKGINIVTASEMLKVLEKMK
ncbi:MAG: putative toxin-antitoxin system toxin component, PIN family [Methanobacteriota archaeon]